MLRPLFNLLLSLNRACIHFLIYIIVVVSEAWRPVLEVAGGGVLSLSNGSLIFDSVALSDAGLYTCHVENGVGEALSKTVWISVNSEYKVFFVRIIAILFCFNFCHIHKLILVVCCYQAILPDMKFRF